MHLSLQLTGVSGCVFLLCMNSSSSSSCSRFVISLNSTTLHTVFYWYCIIFKCDISDFYSDSTWWQAVYEVHWPKVGCPSSWKRLWRKLSYLWPWTPYRPLPQYLGMHYNQHNKNNIDTDNKDPEISNPITYRVLNIHLILEKMFNHLYIVNGHKILKYFKMSRGCSVIWVT